MVRAISSTKALRYRDREILRAIYYHQKLPRNLMLLGIDVLSSRLLALEMAGYIRNTSEGRKLTDAGRLALQHMYDGRNPPMIDTLHEAMLDPEVKRTQFIVGSSLASKIAREVSGGE